MRQQAIRFALLFLILLFSACTKKKETVDIKLLLLNPENYLNQNISIRGRIKEVGPLDLWFIVEDDTGYIQVTTQNVSEKIHCLKKDQTVFANGQLDQYSIHKYFTLLENLTCP